MSDCRSFAIPRGFLNFVFLFFSHFVRAIGEERLISRASSPEVAWVRARTQARVVPSARSRPQVRVPRPTSAPTPRGHRVWEGESCCRGEEEGGGWGVAAGPVMTERTSSSAVYVSLSLSLSPLSWDELLVSFPT